MITLSQEQQQAVTLADEALGKHEDFILGGYAGTGKTETAKHIFATHRNGMACAPTGKAAQRLTQKGVFATTIHSLIYDYDPNKKKFNLKADVDGDWFMIDESSMISQDVLDDLRTFGRPFVFIGDPGQLEPVGDNPNLMQDCDFILQQIHRQEEGSGIIDFASDIRLSQNIWDKQYEYEGVEIHRGLGPSTDQLCDADIILCGSNLKKAALNQQMRDMKGFAGPLCEGEEIIITRNHKDSGLRNGQILTIQDAAGRYKSAKGGSYWRLATYDPILEKDYSFMIQDRMFGSIKQPGNIPFEEVMADYAQAITVHKSQGSEWDNVLVIDENLGFLDMVRWRYTAATRAAKTLKFYF
jgi:exodeoxyribonuclease V